MYAHDPQLGYMPAIPEPFWYSSWRTWFRMKPACYQCGNPLILKDRGAWSIHYIHHHLADDEQQGGAAQ